MVRRVPRENRSLTPFGGPPPEQNREIRGWQALQYAIERNLVETALTIKAVEGPHKHPEAPPGALSFLRFDQMKDVFMVNIATNAKLIGAFGPRHQYWIGKHIRIIPVEHTDQGGDPVWTLEVEPLWRCPICRKDWTADREAPCPWCAYAQRQQGG